MLLRLAQGDTLLREHHEPGNAEALIGQHQDLHILVLAVGEEVLLGHKLNLGRPAVEQVEVRGVRVFELELAGPGGLEVHGVHDHHARPARHGAGGQQIVDLIAGHLHDPLVDLLALRLRRVPEVGGLKAGNPHHMIKILQTERIAVFGIEPVGNSQGNVRDSNHSAVNTENILDHPGIGAGQTQQVSHLAAGVSTRANSRTRKRGPDTKRAEKNLIGFGQGHVHAFGKRGHRTSLSD